MACNDSLINGLVWGGHKGPQLQGNKKIVSLKQCRESGRKTQENNHRMSNALHQYYGVQELIFKITHLLLCNVYTFANPFKKFDKDTANKKYDK